MKSDGSKVVLLTTFFFVRNPDLMGNGRLSLVVQDFKYEEKPL